MMAAGMLAIMVFFTIPSGFLASYAADHLEKKVLKFLLVGALVAEAIGIVAFLLRPTVIAAYVLLALLGTGFGIYTPADALVRGRYFGRKIFGSIQGMGIILTIPFSAVVPVYLGWVHDVTGSYSIAFIIFAVLAVAAAMLACSIRVPNLQAGTSADHGKRS